MDNILIHISDLHVYFDQDNKGCAIERDSFLSVPNNKEPSLHYIDTFISCVKREFPIEQSNIYLIVTGDIANSGEVIEFKFAEEILNKVVVELKIDRSKILLIPGDHDLNRRDIETLLHSGETVTEENLNIEKFKNFATFYKSFLDKTFDPNRIIFDTLNFEDKILLLGINSSYGIDLRQTLGQINIEKFKTELNEIKDDLKKIVVCHHNITSSFEDKNSGQWEKANRTRFIAALDENGIKYIFSGNEHTSSYKQTSGGIGISDSGTLTSKKYDSAFKIYRLDNRDIVLSLYIYGLQQTGGNDQPYFWQRRKNTDAKQPEKIEILLSAPPPTITDIVEIPSSNIEVEDYKQQINDDQNSTAASHVVDVYNNQEIQQQIYDLMREKKAFHSGHFHWSESSRAHNWIDVAKLIEDAAGLNLIQNAVLNLIEEKKINEKVDLIIGLGYEGNIISTKAIIKYGIPYTFLPYSYRWDEHHEFEKQIIFNNDALEYENVLIVTDVVNDGRTLRNLVKGKHWETFFNNVKNIFVISLFYTGNDEINIDILNTNYIQKKNQSSSNGYEEVNNITFYSIKSLKVETCPYGDDYKSKCFIYKDQLNCVNLFYDEMRNDD